MDLEPDRARDREHALVVRGQRHALSLRRDEVQRCQVKRVERASRDLPGQGEITEGKVDDLLTLDAAMHLRFDELAELYLTCSNLLDEQVIVARRPYGVRPNAPRLFALGYKARF